MNTKKHSNIENEVTEQRWRIKKDVGLIPGMNLIHFYKNL